MNKILSSQIPSLREKIIRIIRIQFEDEDGSGKTVWSKYKILIIVILISIVFISGSIILTSLLNIKRETEPVKPVIQGDVTPPPYRPPLESPKIVSTKPDPLEDNIIGASDIVEITFNRPLENVGEFKSRIEPEIEYKVELSGDRKTARIIPAKPYTLGTTFTLYIGPDTKFDGVGNWGQDKTFHFKTITYRGV